ncbi:hypothetical protein RRG08_035007 [Elysia crispata]|uniref:Plethodontid modulating factor n=1 Tax=Elysia crispata TaxID=231223 RepID=A0AAE0ZSI8_9GAST|nr:hypothetical protein RRG08_035007 [Elysia crispata]
MKIVLVFALIAFVAFALGDDDVPCTADACKGNDVLSWTIDGTEVCCDKQKYKLMGIGQNPNTGEESCKCVE